MQDLNTSCISRIHAGFVLGRCHAALQQHELALEAFDAALILTKTGQYLLSEALAVGGRAQIGLAAGGTGAHWDEAMGRQRVLEVLGRMQGDNVLLERALLS